MAFTQSRMTLTLTQKKKGHGQRRKESFSPSLKAYHTQEHARAFARVHANQWKGVTMLERVFGDDKRPPILVAILEYMANDDIDAYSKSHFSAFFFFLASSQEEGNQVKLRK